jgi:hypothetical protein
MRHVDSRNPGEQVLFSWSYVTCFTILKWRPSFRVTSPCQRGSLEKQHLLEMPPGVPTVCVLCLQVVHWQSPHMHAYYPALTSWPSLLGDMLADAINCLGFTWVSSSSCTYWQLGI